MTPHLRKGMFFILFSCFTFCLFAQKIDKSNHSLLWEVTGKDLPAPSYIFGTMHVKNPKAFELPDSLFIALENCSAFANEVQPDSMNFYYWNLYENADTTNFLKKVLGEEAYEALNQRSKDEMGKPIDSLEMKSPMMLKELLSGRDEELDSLSRSKKLDNYLFDLAYVQNKSLHGLELPADRKRLADATFKSYDKSFQESIKIKDTLEFDLSFLDILQEKFETVFQANPMQQMINVYRTGDLEKIKNFYRKGPKDKEYEYEILNRRNKIMVENLLKIGRQEPLFSAVGVAHLIGEENMLDLLREEGYTVRRIIPVFTDFGKNYEPQQVKRAWSELKNTELGEFSVLFPAPPYTAKSNDVKNQLLVSRHRYMNPYTNFVHRAGVQFFPYKAAQLSKEESYRQLVDMYIDRSIYNQEENFIEIEHNGIEGVEFLLYSDSTGEASINRFFLVGTSFYYLEVNMDSKDDDRTDVDKFFNSLKIKNKAPEGWETLVDKKAAFSIYCPAGAQERTITTAVPLEDGSLVDYTLKMWLSSDMEKGDAYIIRTNDFPAGVVMEDDSLYFYATIEEVSTSMQAEVLETKDIIYKGCKGLDATIKLQGINCKIRVILRGGRTYLLLQQKPIGEAGDFNDEFFNSLELLPYEKTEFIPYEYEEENFTLNFPAKPEIGRDTFSIWQFPILYSQRYNSIDNNTGSICLIDIYDFSEYYEMESVDSFYNSMFEIDTSLTNVVTTKTPLTISNIEGYYVRENSDLMSLDYHNWYGLAGNRMYQLNYYSVATEDMDKSVMDFFKSFQLNTESREVLPLQPKLDKIFADLLKEDSLVVEAAELGLDNYSFEEEDKPRIYDYLRNELKADTTLYESILQTLIVGLDDLEKDAETNSLVLELLPTVANNANLQLDLLNLLVAPATPEALTTFFDYAKKMPYDEEDYYYPYHVFEPFRDSIKLAEEYFSDLIELSENQIFTNQVYYVLGHFLDQDTVDTQFILNQAPLFLTKAQSIVNEEKVLESDTIMYFDNKNRLYALLNILSHVKDDAPTKQFFEQLYAVKDPDLLSYSMVVKLKNKEKVDKAHWELLQTNMREYKSLLYQLEEENILDRLPKKYLKPTAITKVLVSVLITDEVYNVDELNYIGKYPRTIEDKEHIIYLYTYKSDEYGGYICATQLKDKPAVIDDAIMRINYSTESEQSPESIIEDWFDED